MIYSTLDDMTAPGTKPYKHRRIILLKKYYLHHQMFVFLSIVYYASVMYIYLR